jgi:hypothetical protein
MQAEHSPQQPSSTVFPVIIQPRALHMAQTLQSQSVTTYHQHTPSASSTCKCGCCTNHGHRAGTAQLFARGYVNGACYDSASPALHVFKAQPYTWLMRAGTPKHHTLPVGPVCKFVRAHQSPTQLCLSSPSGRCSTKAMAQPS